MIHQVVKKISSELEKLVQHNITVERALDLIEASTEDLEELIAINTMRESMLELEQKDLDQIIPPPHLFHIQPAHALMYQS